jgi:ppGpp synthetase/RelA/SpoT-type nucleotidyltranferase
MIYPSILERTYQNYRPFVEQLSKQIKETLLNFCEVNPSYAFISRIKTIESVAEKIETGRFKKWTDLDDLFACSIIIPSLADEENVIKFCQQAFSIQRIIKRGQNKKEPENFIFDTTRIYAKLVQNEDLNSENLLSIYSIPSEIQIKTAFEHAWSVTTHDLVYKSSDIDWRKLRLASQIKANVEQLDTLILAFESISQAIPKSKSSEIQIKNYLNQEIKKLFNRKLINDELFPEDLSRFSDNLYKLLKAHNADLKLENVQSAMNIICSVVEQVKRTEQPLSLSLYQYIIGILLQQNIITQLPSLYTLHITDEFKDFYHEVFETYIQSGQNSIFNYEQ